MEKILLKNEYWKDIPNYEGIYQASNLGRVRTAPNKTTFTQKHGVRHWKVRILKGRGDFYATGRRASLWKNGKCKDWLVARLIAMTFLGMPYGEKNTVNHIDGNRLNNNINNLEWLSLADNIRHAFKTGLMPTQRIMLCDKEKFYTFLSLANASRFLGQNQSYISGQIKRNQKIYDKAKNNYEAILL